MSEGEAWLRDMITAVLIILVLTWISGVLNPTAERQGVLAKTEIGPEQEALIAKHELMPGLTRATAIDVIGTNWVNWETSGWDVRLEDLGPRGTAWIDSRMTPDMVTASWGIPDATTTSGIGRVYVYRQPPDGELRVQFNSKSVAICVDTVLYPEYFRQRFPDWPDAICANVAAREITLGMTAEVVRASWGRPSDINRSVGSWGVHEQWVYRLPSRYLYFENGILTSWQD